MKLSLRTGLLLAFAVWVAFFGLLVAGCASPPDLSAMSSEQLRAAAIDRSAGVSCSSVSTTLTSARVIYVLLDKGVAPTMQIEVAPDCGVKLKSGR